VTLRDEMAKERTKRGASLTQQYQTGAPIAAAVETHMRRKYGERRPMTDSTEVMTITREDVAVTQQAWGAFAPLFKEMGPAMQLARLHKTGFEPYHIDLVHGSLYINIKGLEWHAKQKLGARWGRLVTTLVPEADKLAYGIGPDEIGVIAHYYARHPITLDLEAVPSEEGFGRASTKKGQQVIAGSAIETAHPYRMAQKRAQAACLRNVAPIGIDIGTADEGMVLGVDVPERNMLPEAELVQELDQEESAICFRDDCENEAGPTVDGRATCETHAAEEIAKMVNHTEAKQMEW